MKTQLIISAILALAATSSSFADDGSRLWLSGSNVQAESTLEIANAELEQSWRGGKPVLTLNRSLKGKPEGSYSVAIRQGVPTIEACSPTGLLYGAYGILRLQAMGANVTDTTFTEIPSYNIRILNHWDNLDGTVERGYAGHSIFWPNYDKAHLRAYARANASIGINAFVPDNVNASPKVLSAEYLLQVKEFADIMRPYGIKTYLAINFASLMVLDGMSTADPLDKNVIKWWTAKVKEIYKLIPDFGGFLVKANSEGQPGPNDFGRTHAEGANMLAKALKPYGGIVMWRAFVYSPSDSDRAKQAYLEFQPLDGKFMPNVVIQIKNGPIDFQPREAFSPLFGAMPQSRQMPELQVTQEYLGHSNHIVYLAPMWREFIDMVKTKTQCQLDNDLSPAGALTAFSGVSNIGNSDSWCGNVMAQSNWYAFGRLAWNDDLTPEQIAKEWAAQTLVHPSANSARVSGPLLDMMLRSREACVDYMMPLGLHHQFAWGHHYGPEPYCDIPRARPDWLPSYYSKLDKEGVGFNRSSTGSNATAQYPEAYCKLLDDPETCPSELLLWFHHVAWGKEINDHIGGKTVKETLWNALCHHYQFGLDEVREMQKDWEHMKGNVDPEIFNDIQRRLRIQARDAQWWKDGCLLYFQTFSGMPFPDDIEPAVHNLEKLKNIHLQITNSEAVTEDELDSKR